MPKETLVFEAKMALVNIFSDVSVSIEDTLSRLEQVEVVLSGMIKLTKEDVVNKLGSPPDME